METKLPKNLFINVHRSYILSVLKIESYTNEYIQIGDKMIGISRGYKVDVLNSLSNYE